MQSNQPDDEIEKEVSKQNPTELHSDDTIDPVDLKSLMDTVGPTSSESRTNSQAKPTNNRSEAGLGETLDIPPSSEESSNEPTQEFVVDSDATAVFRTPAKFKRDTKHSMPKRVGDYEIHKILGRGGMGIVYKATHRTLQRTVALKMILSGSHASSEQLDRFVTEGKAVAHLQHPNIVQIFDVGEQENLPYFSLEYVDGDSLDRHLAGKPLAPIDAAKLMETIGRAMQYAHDNGILHRDLKPANVLMTQSGIPKITDFGLAKRLEDGEDSASTRTGTIMGTPSYMSPEQASGNVRELAPTTDQYSLGAMLYEFLTGRPPFLAAKAVDTILQVMLDEPIPPRQLQPKLPVDLETICLKALQKEPSKRYRSCTEFADDLARFVKGEPIMARPVGRFERAWRWCKRNPIVAGLSATAMLSLLAVAIVSTWSSMALAGKNSLLESTNSSLNLANSNLEKSNKDLQESNEEKLRRSKRLEQYVQDVFKQLNRINVLENPRMREYKEQTLKKTLPLIEEYALELPEGQGAAEKISALNELSSSYRDQGMGEEAEKINLEAIGIARRRVEVQKESDASRNNVSLLLTVLSSIRAELKRDIQASREAIEEAIIIDRSILADSKAAPNGLGKNPRYKSEAALASHVQALGLLCYRNGDSKKAIEQNDEAIEIYQRVFQKFEDKVAFDDIEDKTKIPNEMESQQFLARLRGQYEICLLAKATAMSRIGEFEKAQPIFLQNLKVADQAFNNDPNNPAVARRLVGSLGNCGEILAWHGKVNDGLVYFRRAAEIGLEKLSAFPESRELSGAAATAYHRLAQWLPNEESQKAIEWFKRSLKIREDAAKLDPNNDRRQLELMVCASRAGTVEQAIAIADKYIAAQHRDVEMLIEIAQAYSQCSLRVNEEQKVKLQSNAIRAIRDALSLGFSDWIVLESDIDLAPLRSNGTLRELLR